MRGRFSDQGGLFSYIRPEDRIPADHPLREIRKLVREVLKELSHSFGKLYAPRTGGAYDSHHWTAGIAGRTRRRGSSVAARGASAATQNGRRRAHLRPGPSLPSNRSPAHRP